MIKAIGKVRKPHGKDGEIKVAIDPIYIPLFKNQKMISIAMPTGLVPYKILNIRSINPFIISLKGINSNQQALALNGRTIMADVISVPTEVSQSSSQPKGYAIIQDGKQIGKVLRVEDYPMQEMLVVVHEENEFLIPFVASFINSIDHAKQEIVMNLPQGLLDI